MSPSEQIQPLLLSTIRVSLLFIVRDKDPTGKEAKMESCPARIMIDIRDQEIR